MRQLVRSLFILAFVLSFSTAQTLPLKREVRGAWIATVANIDWPTPNLTVAAQKTQLTTILDQLAAAGINVVIFQIRPECDALYDSPYEPWSYWLTGEQGKAPSPYYDPLAFAVEEAHKRGMELHAWFNPYRAERSAGNYTTAGNHVTKAHPDWVLQIGSVRFLDPGLQQVRDHVSKVIADVVRRYDVDAAHMDDYFYVEPMGSQDANTFATYPRGFTNLGDWRRDNVNLLIKQVYDSIQAIKPWVKWGISPRGIWRNGVPTGIIGNDNYSTIFCDATAWLNGKYIDYLAPQLYWKIGGSQDYTKLLPWWSSVSNGRWIIPGLAAYRIGQSSYGPASEVANQIRFYRPTSYAPGNFIYTTNNITGNLGGITDTLKKDLYQYPALVPSMSWKDSIAPNTPQNIRFDRLPDLPLAVVCWDVPVKATDNDTASRYVVYQTSGSVVGQADIDDARNITKVVDRPYFNPLTTSKTLNNFTVTALDRNHNESGPSATVSVGQVPAAPVLASPIGDSSVPTTSVTLRWNYGTGSGAYIVMVSSDSAFAADTVTSPAIFDSAYTVTRVEGQQHYYWKVKGRNLLGDGAYSGAGTFFTSFPATPEPAMPANFTLNTNADTLMFAWNATPGAASYRFQLSAPSDFSVLTEDSSGITDTSLTVYGLKYTTIYNWRVIATNASGLSNWSEVFRFKTKTITDVLAEGTVPTVYELYQNYPNPFNPVTNIRFTIVDGNYTILKIYNILGEEVATLVDEQLNPGTYTVPFNGSSLASGVYIYRIISGNFTAAKKMLLQK